MPVSLILSVSALIALLPAALLPLRRGHARDPVFWTLLAVALAGPLAVVYVLFASGWRTGMSPSLWLAIVTSLVIFAGLAAFTRTVWRLAPLLLPYLIVLGVIATIWQHRPEQPLSGQGLSLWTEFHIGFGLVTYGLFTIGAVAGLAVLLQERALKSKRPNALTRLLPSVSDGETLQVRLLAASAAVLAGGLASGMAAQYLIDASLIAINHKTVLTVLAFAVIVALLVAHRMTGIRGRRAARVVLLAYLLLTLGYPGVKFVTDVIVG